MTAAVRKAELFDDTYSVPVAPMPHGVHDEVRGTQAMKLFIATEAMLFVMLFWSYFYLGHNAPAASWETPLPKLLLPFIMLVVLLSSSALLHWGERQVDSGETATGRAAAVGTALLGMMFLGLQAYEYSEAWKEITPMTNAYGSIFYTLTGVHGAHVTLGVLMLLFVSMLPRIGKTDRPPYRPLHNAALYWHFVDIVWVFIVAVLYVMPHLKR